MLAEDYWERRDWFLERLRTARKRAHLTQAEVAKLVGKPQSFISKAETGERRLDFIELETLANIYKARLEYFATLSRRTRKSK